MRSINVGHLIIAINMWLVLKKRLFRKSVVELVSMISRKGDNIRQISLYVQRRISVDDGHVFCVKNKSVFENQKTHLRSFINLL